MTATLTINVSNLVKNYQALTKYLGKDTKAAAVVKCNCYGLGIAKIAPALLKAGCEEFYVAQASEGLALRKLLETATIYVLNGIKAGEEKKFLKANLIPVLNNIKQIELWTKAAKKLGRKLSCAVHVDSGMTRLGVDCHLIEEAFNKILKDKQLEVCYVLSHLACADDVTSEMNSSQLEFIKSLKKKYPQFKYSISSSAGIFLGKEYHFDQVRPGVALYVGNPYGDAATTLPITLLPVVGLTSKIIDIHLIKDETIQKSIGYNATHKLKPGMVTATIPVGYGDGYPRALSNKGYCYINGVKVNIIGRISMDLLCLDISNLLERFQRVGQEVELIGDNISIEKIARLADTIGYEVLTSLGNRYIRKYIL
jgi:alanine racemase